MKLKNESGKVSKTVIFNALIGSLGIVEANFSLLQNTALGPKAYAIAFIAISVVGYFLRAITAGGLNK